MSQLSREQLLAPRFKVIADYPGSCHKVGDIISPYLHEVASMHPHLFKRLQWWEDRTKDQMPPYVADNQNGEVYKADWYDNAPFFDDETDPAFQHAAWNFLPSTKEEYELQASTNQHTTQGE